jgi:hypothetical protein
LKIRRPGGIDRAALIMLLEREAGRLDDEAARYLLEAARKLRVELAEIGSRAKGRGRPVGRATEPSDGPGHSDPSEPA